MSGKTSRSSSEHCCPAYFRSQKLGEDKAESGKRKAESTLNNQPSTLNCQSPTTNYQLPTTNSQLSTFNFQLSTLNPQSTPNSAGPNSDTSPYPLPERGGEGVWLPVGSSADITCFSFYANKCITTGEGGMACTQRDDYAERMRIMSLHGISKDPWKRFTAEGSWYYEIVAPGFKYNLTDIAAAIGIHQLRRADELHRKRAQWAGLYSELLGGVEELILPTQQPDRIHSWHLYVIRLRLDRLRINRAEMIDALKKAGITSSVHWMPLHEHPYYREKYGYKPDDFPVAARLYPELITLPLYPDMTEAEIAYVCDTLKGIVRGNLKSRTTGRQDNKTTGRQDDESLSEK